MDWDLGVAGLGLSTWDLVHLHLGFEISDLTVDWDRVDCDLVDWEWALCEFKFGTWDLGLGIWQSLWIGTWNLKLGT